MWNIGCPALILKELIKLVFILLPRGSLAHFPDQTPKVKVKVQWVDDIKV